MLSRLPSSRPTSRNALENGYPTAAVSLTTAAVSLNGGRSVLSTQLTCERGRYRPTHDIWGAYQPEPRALLNRCGKRGKLRRNTSL